MKAVSFVDLEWKTGIRPVWVNRKAPGCFGMMQFGKVQHPTAITLVRVREEGGVALLSRIATRRGSALAPTEGSGLSPLPP